MSSKQLDRETSYKDFESYLQNPDEVIEDFYPEIHTIQGVNKAASDRIPWPIMGMITETGTKDDYKSATAAFFQQSCSDNTAYITNCSNLNQSFCQ